MLHVILLQLLWMRGDLQVQFSNCPVVKLWSRRSRLKFLLFQCVVHVSLEGTEKLHNLFTLVVQCRSLGQRRSSRWENLSPRLKDSTSGEDNTHTIVPSDSNTMSNLGLASVLTECVRVHGAWSEFLDKFS